MDAFERHHPGKGWHVNFNKRPDFKPNYIVPNMSSILRCISGRKGLAVIPDFLSKRDLVSGNIKIVWEGKNPIENTLYFGSRSKTIYAEEIEQIEAIFEKEMI